jgi:ribosomal protein S4
MIGSNKVSLYRNRLRLETRSPNSIRKIYDYRKMLFSFILENRKIINMFMFDKLISKKTTRILVHNFKNSIFQLIKKMKSFAFFIIFSVRLAFSMQDLQFLFSNNLIFVNKKLVNNFYYLIKKNDTVTIIYSKNIYYYVIYKQLNIVSSIRKFKWKHAFKLRINFNQLTKARFFSSKYFKSFIHSFYQIPKFLEIDYSILTIFVVSAYVYTWENIWWTKFFSVYISNIYNWKRLS